jgi:class 3 adenylate cyclase
LPIWKFRYEPRRALFIAVGVAAAAVVAWLAGVSRELDQSWSRPLAFRARQALGLEPAIDPRLKLLVLDDAAVASRKGADLSPKVWADLLDALAKQQPRVVLIDADFSLPLRQTLAAEDVARLDSLSFPIAAGALLSASAIEGREPLDAPRPDLSLTTYAPSLADAAWLPPAVGRYVYGPDHSMAPAFARLGNREIESHQRGAAFLRLSDGTGVPHFALTAASKLRIDASGVFADDRRVGLDADGRFVVDLVDPARLASPSHSIRLDHALDQIAHGDQIPGIAEGDTVVVLPGVFSGGDAVRQTDRGEIVGGLLRAMAVNSVLTGKWIRFVEPWQDLLLATAAAGVASVVATALPLRVAVPLLLFGFGAFAAGSVALFAWLSWSLSWLFIGLSGAGAGLAIAFDRARSRSHFADRLADSMRGQMAPEHVQELLLDLDRLDLRPRNQAVTMMFVDLVGFSRLAEDLPADQLFGQLKDHLQEMRSTIHKHQGFIDRSLGDGLLCYFGFRPDNVAPTAGNHADQALACAIELQQMNLQRNLAAKATNRVSHPMRIGINTATVCLGDLGDANRIDFTVIGHGVNFAKRLETACENYRIMLSRDTKDQLSVGGCDTRFLHQRYVQVKHHTELLEAYEFDPLGGLEEEKFEAIRHYWSLIGVRRKDSRYEVSTAVAITMVMTQATGRIANFSTTGIAFYLDKYIACGASIGFLLDDPSGDLGRRCRERRILPLEAEIRWGQREGTQFLHGALIKGLNVENQQWLFQTLSEYSSAMFTPGGAGTKPDPKVS